MAATSLPGAAIDAEAQMRLDDVGRCPAPGLLAAESAPRDGEGDGTLSPRQCGRCRKLFAGDPTLHPVALPEWWLCLPCRLALLGDRPRPPGDTDSGQTEVGTHRAH